MLGPPLRLRLRELKRQQHTTFGLRPTISENIMRVDPAHQQMRRTGWLADSIVNIVQDIVARDISRLRVGFEDCWIHADSTPFYTFQRVTRSALRAVTVVLFRHHRPQVIRGTRELIHIRCTMTCNQTLRGKAEFTFALNSCSIHSMGL